ncbi:MAG: GAF and ANTAR domain-containing protein [Nocardioides sp.]
MGPARDHLAAMAAAARSAGRQETLPDTLRSIVESARLSVPGFDHVGISLIDARGRIETKAATDDLVWELDRLQYDVGEGPCVSAMREVPVVAVPHAADEGRWPAFMPPAVALGLRAQLAVRLFLDENGSMGALNLYSTSRDTIDPDAENIADLYAAHAAVALDKTRTVEHLNAALHSRGVIGQAIGIVMERYRLDEDTAFAYLLRVSSQGNTKLRDIADELVAATSERHAALRDEGLV